MNKDEIMEEFKEKHQKILEKYDMNEYIEELKRSGAGISALELEIKDLVDETIKKFKESEKNKDTE